MMTSQMDDVTLKDDSPQQTIEKPAVCSITRVRAGSTCPRCGRAKLDYNGLLQLVCPNCGLIETGAST
jgi:uncharacterized protein (DUF983 family)